MRIQRVGLVAVLAVMIASLSCGKDEQEAAKFERADHETFVRDMSDLTSITLSNGVTAYIQEERTNHQVAIEVIYQAGLLEEPKGVPELAHAAEHMTMHCASGEFEADGSLDLITSKRGMVAAESVPYFCHFDYVVENDDLEMILNVESQRLRSIRCDDDIFMEHMKKVESELDNAIPNPKITLSKYGFMALNQIAGHGERRVAFRESWKKIDIPSVEAFHDKYFRPDDMVIVIIGHIATEDAEALVRKYFESIPRRPVPDLTPIRVSSDIQATWDVNAEALFLVAQGQYTDLRERLILTMFGSYVHQMMMTTQDIYGVCRSVYASNQVYRVDDLPFFIYAEPGKGYSAEEVAPLLLNALEQAVSDMDQNHIDAIKGAMTSFQTSTMLKPDVPDYPLQHFQVIGQEALNVGMKHELREGMTPEAFISLVESITAEDVRAVLGKYVTRANMKRITIKPRAS